MGCWPLRPHASTLTERNRHHVDLYLGLELPVIDSGRSRTIPAARIAKPDHSCQCCRETPNNISPIPMSIQPIQRFPNGIASPPKLICPDRAVEMPDPCKGWNGENVPPFTPPLGRRRKNWRLPHCHRHDDGGNKVKEQNDKTYWTSDTWLLRKTTFMSL
jgi:hypothetical protein